MGGVTPKRGNFATLNDADLAYFRAALGSDDAVLTDAKSLAEANEDWMRKYKGTSRVLLLPRTTQQVAAVLRHCNARRLAVVPQGGNTGLVGGGVPLYDEVVLGLKRMVRCTRAAGETLAPDLLLQNAYPDIPNPFVWFSSAFALLLHSSPRRHHRLAPHART